MQGEVENRAANLAISTAKLTARITPRLALWGIRKIKESEVKAEVRRNFPPRGKQIIREPVGQNQGVINTDTAGTGLKGFEKYAREFGADYAVIRDESVNSPKHLVLFKARDADAMTAVFNTYSAEAFAKNKCLSALKTLYKLMDTIRNIPAKMISRDRQREQSR